MATFRPLHGGKFWCSGCRKPINSATVKRHRLIHGREEAKEINEEARRRRPVETRTKTHAQPTTAPAMSQSRPPEVQMDDVGKVTCPHCQAYQVPCDSDGFMLDENIPSRGQSVRCNTCSRYFTVLPPDVDSLYHYLRPADIVEGFGRCPRCGISLWIGDTRQRTFRCTNSTCRVLIRLSH